MKEYCQVVDNLVGSSTEEKANTSSPSTEDYKEIVVTDDGGARTILLNRPAKYNALNYQVSAHSFYSTLNTLLCHNVMVELQPVISAKRGGHTISHLCRFAL